MLDRNGIEMKTGDIVKTSGAYFKNDNGYWYVAHSPGDPTWCGADYSLKKISKRGKISTAKHSIAFWPLKAFTSNRMKNALCREHNKDHAVIEVMTGIDRSEIAAHFLEESHTAADRANEYRWRFGDDYEWYHKELEISGFYKNLAEKIGAEVQ